jgi:hypothetical protein
MAMRVDEARDDELALSETGPSAPRNAVLPEGPGNDLAVTHDDDGICWPVTVPSMSLSPTKAFVETTARRQRRSADEQEIELRL